MSTGLICFLEKVTAFIEFHSHFNVAETLGVPLAGPAWVVTWNR